MQYLSGLFWGTEYGGRVGLGAPQTAAQIPAYGLTIFVILRIPSFPSVTLVDPEDEPSHLLARGITVTAGPHCNPGHLYVSCLTGYSPLNNSHVVTMFRLPEAISLPAIGPEPNRTVRNLMR